MKPARGIKIMVLPALVVIALDQASKVAVSRAMLLHDSVPVIPGFFNIVDVRNRGIAFGLFSQLDAAWAAFLLSAAAAAAILLLILWAKKLRPGDDRLAFGLSLIIGGAAGNLIDRIRLGAVIDFLDFYVGSFHWPAFNIADSAVTLGTIWVVMCMVFFQPLEEKK